MGSYLSFYILYYMLVALHAKFAETVIGIKRRYLRLNATLRKISAFHLFLLFI